MKITYESGKNLEESYFVVTEGEDSFKVQATQVIPLQYQEKIASGDENVISPEEAIAQMTEENKTIEDFKKFAKKSKIKIVLLLLKLRKKKKLRKKLR